MNELQQKISRIKQEQDAKAELERQRRWTEKQSRIQQEAARANEARLKERAGENPGEGKPGVALLHREIPICRSLNSVFLIGIQDQSTGVFCSYVVRCKGNSVPFAVGPGQPQAEAFRKAAEKFSQMIHAETPVLDGSYLIL